MNILLIIVGGFLGSVSRFLIGDWVSNETGFPFGTLYINLMGCFFLGWLFSFTEKRTRKHPRIVLFLGTGFTGSFTTFSTFSVETVQLAEAGSIWLAGLYVLLSVFLGVLFAYSGKKLAESFTFKEGDPV